MRKASYITAKKMNNTTYSVQGPVSLKLALLTDFHNGDDTGIGAALQEQRPDVICIAGDFFKRYGMTGKEGQALSIQGVVLRFLITCAEIAPTFVSLGNHEQILTEEELRVVAQTGIILLDNDWINIDVDGVSVAIGGLTSKDVYLERDPWWMEDFGWVSDFESLECYKILMCHHPEYWEKETPKLKDRNIDLVLSGHAHGGQIRLMNRGLYSPGQGLLPKYTKGVHEGPHGKLIVSAGLSNTAGVVPRLFNPTEIVYVKLENE